MLPSRRLIALAGVLLSITHPFLHAQEDTTKTPATAGAPVVFAGDTLFSLHARIGPFSPQDRARAITQRMSKLSQDPICYLDPSYSKRFLQPVCSSCSLKCGCGLGFAFGGALLLLVRSLWESAPDANHYLLSRLQAAQACQSVFERAATVLR